MQEDLAIIKRGTDEILTESDLKKKLDSGKQFSFGYDYKLSSKAKVFYFFTDLNGNQDSKEKEIHGVGFEYKF